MPRKKQELVPLGQVETAPAERSVEALLSQAIDKGVPVETLERLLVMRDKLKAEAARELFNSALAAFQQTCPAVPRSRTALIESRSGGRYSYTYASLEDIVKTVRHRLAARGFSYQFDSAVTEGNISVTCTIRHAAGHSETSTFRAPIEQGARMNPVQQVASATSYAKRYAFSNALGIVTADDDDDAHTAGGGKKPTTLPLKEALKVVPPRRKSETIPCAAPEEPHDPPDPQGAPESHDHEGEQVEPPPPPAAPQVRPRTHSFGVFNPKTGAETACLTAGIQKDTFMSLLKVCKAFDEVQGRDAHKAELAGLLGLGSRFDLTEPEGQQFIRHLNEALLAGAKT